jgi:hypothetical protein
VKTPRRANSKKKTPTLQGSWFNADEYRTDVEFIISKSGDSFTVRARDREDGEEADIFETGWDGSVLSFATHWNSSGRFVRYRLRLLSANRLDVTYTYTDMEMFHRNRTKRSA